MAWKKFLAVGCSHGGWADPVALKTVLKFRDTYKPNTVIHLGDYFDVASLRSGADAQDKAVDLRQDITSGINFLEELAPNWLFDGNHDDRVAKLIHHPNKTTAYLAKTIWDAVEDLAARIKAKRVPYDIETGWRKPLGSDCSVGHGYMYNEMALRDHAEYCMTPQTIIAHLHTPGIANGRRADHPVAYCSGYLGIGEKFTYAKTNKAKSRWNQGFLWGEYNDKVTIIRLEQRASNGTWRLPV